MPFDDIGEVIASDMTQKERQNLVAKMLYMSAMEGREILAARADCEDGEQRNIHLDVECIDCDGESKRGLTVYTTDEVPFREMMEHDNILLYTSIPVRSIFEMAHSGFVDVFKIRSMEGDLIIPANAFLQVIE